MLKPGDLLHVITTTFPLYEWDDTRKFPFIGRQVRAYNYAPKSFNELMIVLSIRYHTDSAFASKLVTVMMNERIYFFSEQVTYPGGHYRVIR